jgi:hypothetical protein
MAETDILTKPEPAKTKSPDQQGETVRQHDLQHDMARDDREATEMEDVSRPATAHSHGSAISDHGSASGPVYRRPIPGPVKNSFIGKVQRFWRRHIAAVVPHDKCRDHLGEGTHLLLVSSRS